jgi:uncharacterized repeat protein (TIGR04076 family)
MERLEIVVKEIRGKCPVFKPGDRIVIEGPEVKLDETDAICTHAFASLLPYIVALRKGIKPNGLPRQGRGLRSVPHLRRDDHLRDNGGAR